MLTSFDVGSEEAVKGPDVWLKKSHTYQAREVQEPEKKNITNSEKGGGSMVEVSRRGVGGSRHKPIFGSKRSCPTEKKHQLSRWEGRVVVLGWEGGGNEPTQADARHFITGKEQNDRFRW